MNGVYFLHLALALLLAPLFTGIINRSMSAEEFFRVIEKVVDVRFTMNKGNRVAITAK